MDLAERESFLQENGVGYVLVGSRELEIGEWRLEGEPVFEADDVVVYKVNR